MPVNLPAARQFIFANARLLDRHRAAVLLDGAPADAVVQALRAYRNPARSGGSRFHQPSPTTRLAAARRGTAPTFVDSWG